MPRHHSLIEVGSNKIEVGSHIVEYDIVTVPRGGGGDWLRSSVAELGKKINIKIKEGWSPMGGVEQVVGEGGPGGGFCQAIVKYG